MRWLAVPLLLLSTVAAAPASRKVPIRFVSGPKEALEIARTRGKMIFLTVLVDNDPCNEAVITKTFKDRKLQKILKDFVCLYANPDDDHGEKKIKIGGKKVRVCRHALTHRCEAHQKTAHTFARAFYQHDVRTPYHFVLDADEEVVARIFNGDPKTGFMTVAAGEMATKLKALIRKHGPGLSEAQYKAMMDALKSAKAARTRDALATEVKYLLPVALLKVDVEGVRAAKARLKEIEKVGAERLAAIRTEIQNENWEGALESLTREAETFTGTQVGTEIAKTLKKLRQNPAVKRFIKARDLYKLGMAYKEKGRMDAARKKLEECVRRFKDTEYGQLAAQELAGMK